MMILLAATGFSIAMITLLWRGDPKRRRVAGLPSGEHSAPKRRLIFVALLLPGLFFVVAGDSSAFLIWLGCCAVGGWLITQLGIRDPAK
jgi:hypothetical protein